MSLTDAVQGLLSQTPLTELVKTGKQVVTLEHNVTIGEAMNILAKKRILSAPIIAGFNLEDASGVESIESAGPTLLGWLDVDDILRGLLRYLKERHSPMPTKMLQLMTVLEADGPHFAQRMVVTLTGGADRGLLYKADAGNSLLEVVRNVFLQPSSEGSRVVHRLAVFDAHGEVTSVVSQADVVRYIYSKLNSLGGSAGLGLGSTTIEALGMLTGKPPVVCVSPHEPALVAYDRMQGSGVSGAAVVADSGELMANISISDLRCLQPEHFGALALPVGEFLALLHGTTYVGYSQSASSAAHHPFFAAGTRGGPASPRRAAAADADEELRLITVTASTTFYELLQRFVSAHVHRVYCVDSPDTRRAIAVISLTDVLRLASGVY